MFISELSCIKICICYSYHLSKQIFERQLTGPSILFLSCEGHLTTKCEVYSFGVVLLELLCGRPAIDINRPYKEANLVQWARPSLSPRKIFRILDARCFSPFFLSESVLKTAELISLCVSSEPMSRPTMREVVEALGKIQELNRNVISRA